MGETYRFQWSLRMSFGRDFTHFLQIVPIDHAKGTDISKEEGNGWVSRYPDPHLSIDL